MPLPEPGVNPTEPCPQPALAPLGAADGVRWVAAVTTEVIDVANERQRQG